MNDAPRRDELASVNQRAFARLLDFVTIGLLGLVVAIPGAITVDDDIVIPVWVRLSWMAIFITYEAGFVAWLGATPGKMALRIRLADVTTGARPSLGRSLVRALIAATVIVLLGQFAFFALAALYLSALLDLQTHRGLLDRAAHTVVVRVPR